MPLEIIPTNERYSYLAHIGQRFSDFLLSNPDQPVGDNQRVKKMGMGGTVNYLFDGLSVIQETDGGGNLLKKYNPGISETDSTGTELFYAHDGLGSVVNLTDAKGNLVDKTEYEAFGQKGVSKSGYYFTGATDGYTDADVQLVYMWNRWCDEGTGRFISGDPIGLAGGLNQFEYVASNPIIDVCISNRHIDGNTIKYRYETTRNSRRTGKTQTSCC